MNATPTTLGNAPRRSQRGIARGIARGIELVVCAIAAVWMLAGADFARAQSITYRGAGAAASATSGNIATGPALPTGWQLNDIHIALIEACNTSGTIPTVSMPAGWTLINQGSHLFGSNDGCRAALYWRKAQAGDTAPQPITNNGGDTIIAFIMGFYNVDPDNPIDAPGTFINSSNGEAVSQGVRAGAVTTTTADTMLVFAGFFPDDDYGPQTPTCTPACTPWSSQIYRTVSVSPGTDNSIAVYYGLRSAIGSQPQATSSISVNDYGRSGVQFALRRNLGIIPGRFNAYDTTTAAGAIIGFIKTKVAGTTVNAHMIAVNAAKTAIDTAFTGPVRVEVLDASNNSAALDVDACRSSWTVIQTLPLDSTTTFIAGDNGRKAISFTLANSYPDVRLRISYPTTSPTLIGCSTDNFANRPNAFTGLSVMDNTWTTATPATRTLNNTAAPPGGIIHKAGQPFTVQATAVNGAGTPATTTNYNGTPTATLSDCGASSACPTTPGTMTLGTPFASGVLNSTTASYNDVGSFAMQLMDMTFSNVDAADGSPADCTATGRYVCSAAPINVGRFVPDNFLVSLNTPGFGTACGTFTYVGQKFNYVTAPVITVTARNAANGTTANYTGALWQITSASLSNRTYTAASGTLDTSGLPGTDPVISSGAGGVGTLTFGSGTGVSFTRTTPVAPFNADISLAIDLGNDADNVAIYASNPARFSQATAGNGIAFSSGKPMRFGRLTIRNAAGSQLLPLRVRVEAQYWSGAPNNAFITNTLDNCTSIATTNVAMSNYTGNLAACETANTAVSTLSSGRGVLTLAKPVGSAPYDGSVLLTPNLGASASGNTCTATGAGPGAATTAANLPHLQGNWTGGAYTANPSAQATFGIYSGNRELIFVRENF